MSQQRLYAAVHRHAGQWLGGYLPAFAKEGVLAQCIVPPQCRQPSGLIGAYLLAQRAAGRRS
jgi:fructokinase